VIRQFATGDDDALDAHALDRADPELDLAVAEDQFVAGSHVAARGRRK